MFHRLADQRLEDVVQCGAEGVVRSGEGSIQRTKAVVLETRSGPLCGLWSDLVGSQAFHRMKLSASRSEPARTSTVVG
jgi:hypothetical protein